MKKIAGLALIGYIMLCSLPAEAQTYSESALMFSRIRPAGSARIQALGGAQVSLGGDYSSALSNPAGLGMFNKSEFTISPGFNMNSTSSGYLGTNTADSKNTFQIPGISLVLHTSGQTGGFLGGNVGFSYSRVNDFNRNFSYSGNNTDNSIIDYFLKDANGFSSSTLEVGGDYSNNPTALAYRNHLIVDSAFFYPGTKDSDFFSDLQRLGPSDPRTVFQLENIQTTGSQGQWSISYGANFADKLFIGAGLGITSIKYSSNKTYHESNFNFASDPDYHPLDNIELNEKLTTNGNGVNLNIGAIYRPIDIIQLGLSYNSPTWYSMSDNYSATMSTKWNNYDFFATGTNKLNDVSDYTDVVVSEYNLRTPSRTNLGATFFMRKAGFITGSVEFINYAGAKYSTSTTSGVDKDYYDTDNDDIRSSYQSTVNFRLGMEFRIKAFRLRGGYSYMPDPNQTTQNNVSNAVDILSGGVGYRTKSFYVDLALVNTTGNSTYRPYSVNSPLSPVVNTANKNNFLMVTVGLPF